MKFTYLPISVVLILLFTVNCCFAGIQYSEKLIKDVAFTYGYYTGQEITLTAIEKKYPSLKNQVLIAKNTFSAAFGSSLKNIESEMHKKNRGKRMEVC